MRRYFKAGLSRKWLAIGILALACSLGCADQARSTGSRPDAPDESQRIARIEGDILPQIRIRGKGETFTLIDRMRHYNIPGASLAVIVDGRLAWAKGYGVLAADGEKPVDEETLFQAASISKPVTALATIRLSQQNRIDLDADVNTLLSSWKLPENEFTRQSPVTLRTIMSHTAGLTVHGFPGYPLGQELPSVPQILDGQPPSNTAPVRVDKLPGEGARYSGGGTTIMQLAIQDVASAPFPEHLRASVLEPLGMQRSTFEQPLPDGLKANAARAHDREGKRLGTDWHAYPEMAAAGLWTTPSDLARAAIAVQKAATGLGEGFLKPEAIEDMLTPRNGSPFGLGFMIEGSGENLRFAHGGSNRGFRCHLVAYSQKGLGAVVMTNGARGGEFVREVIDTIASVYEWPEHTPSGAEIAEVDPAILAVYAGKYQAQNGRTFEISVRDGYLIGETSGERPRRVLPETDTEFVVRGVGTRIRFLLQDGSCDSFVMQIPDGEVIRAIRVRE